MPKDDEHTGCGISPLASGERDPFYHACRVHDLMYLENSWHQQQIKRKEADIYFFNMMLKLAEGNPLLIMKAHLYYRLARLFGSRFWEGKR
jgi:hypothetical protein